MHSRELARYDVTAWRSYCNMQGIKIVSLLLKTSIAEKFGFLQMIAFWSVLRQDKCYNVQTLLTEFPNKNLTMESFCALSTDSADWCERINWVKGEQWQTSNKARQCIKFNIKYVRMLYLQLGSTLFHSPNSNRHISRLVIPNRLKFGTHISTYY